MTENNDNKELAVILVRSIIGLKPDHKNTLKLLNLMHKNGCVIIPDTPSYKGMLQKVKDFVTWGNISSETKKILIEKKKKDENQKLFRLSPPKKGYGSAGIKMPYSVKGALGNRGDNINELIMRMI
jgi:large subunit ribosomal protein L30